MASKKIQVKVDMEAVRDSVTLDIVAEILRTPEWSASTIEDIAEQVGKVRDIESLNARDEHGDMKDSGDGEGFVAGRDWPSH